MSNFAAYLSKPKSLGIQVSMRYCLASTENCRNVGALNIVVPRIYNSDSYFVSVLLNSKFCYACWYTLQSVEVPG